MSRKVFAASNTALVSALDFSARARSSAATASIAGEIRARSLSLSVTLAGPGDGSGTGSGIRTSGPTEIPGHTPIPLSSVTTISALPDGSAPVLFDVGRCSRWSCDCVTAGASRHPLDVHLRDLHDLVDAGAVLGLVDEELRRQPDADDLQSQRRADDLAAEAEHVRVGVGAGQSRTEGVLADGRVHAWQLVRDQRAAVADAVHQDRPVRVAVGHGARGRVNEVRQVGGLGRVRAEVGEVVLTRALEDGLDLLLEGEPRVVARQGDAHLVNAPGWPPRRRPAPRPRD